MSTTQTNVLQHYTSDMKGATVHIVEAFHIQLADSRVQQIPAVVSLLNKLHTTFDAQSKELDTHLSRFGGDTAGTLKAAVTAVTGTLAGLYGKLRQDPVSKILRDNYTALSLAQVSNSMLHTTALGVGDQLLAGATLRHMKEIAPLIIEVGEAILPVVEQELSEEVTVAAGSSATALENLRQVWSRS